MTVEASSIYSPVKRYTIRSLPKTYRRKPAARFPPPRALSGSRNGYYVPGKSSGKQFAPSWRWGASSDAIPYPPYHRWRPQTSPRRTRSPTCLHSRKSVWTDRTRTTGNSPYKPIPIPAQVSRTILSFLSSTRYTKKDNPQTSPRSRLTGERSDNPLAHGQKEDRRHEQQAG